MSRLRDGQYNKRRTIRGIRVLVAAQLNATGVTPENFTIRIKHPAGDIDAVVTASYYWQAFNYARQLIR